LRSLLRHRHWRSYTDPPSAFLPSMHTHAHNPISLRAPVLRIHSTPGSDPLQLIVRGLPAHCTAPFALDPFLDPVLTPRPSPRLAKTLPQAPALCSRRGFRCRSMDGTHTLPRLPPQPPSPPPLRSSTHGPRTAHQNVRRLSATAPATVSCHTIHLHGPRRLRRPCAIAYDSRRCASPCHCTTVPAARRRLQVRPSPVALMHEVNYPRAPRRRAVPYVF